MSIATVSGVFAIGFLAFSYLLAQQEVALQAESALVLVPTVVLDRNDRFIEGLQKQNFHVYDDGHECAIESLSREAEPVSVAVVLDLSSSVKLQRHLSNQTLRELFRTANEGDEFLVVGVGNQSEVLSDWTQDVDALLPHLLSLQRDGSTALYDGIHLAARELKSAHQKRHALVVITDAEENHSRVTERALQGELREAAAPLFVIAFPLWSIHEAGPWGEAFLEQMADENGGHYVHLKRETDLAKAIDTLNFRDEYVLAIRPAQSHVIGSHHLTVTLKLPGQTIKPHLYWRKRYESFDGAKQPGRFIAPPDSALSSAAQAQ